MVVELSGILSAIPNEALPIAGISIYIISRLEKRAKNLQDSVDKANRRFKRVIRTLEDVDNQLDKVKKVIFKVSKVQDNNTEG